MPYVSKIISNIIEYADGLDKNYSNCMHMYECEVHGERKGGN